MVEHFSSFAAHLFGQRHRLGVSPDNAPGLSGQAKKAPVYTGFEPRLGAGRWKEEHPSGIGKSLGEALLETGEQLWQRVERGSSVEEQLGILVRDNMDMLNGLLDELAIYPDAIMQGRKPSLSLLKKRYVPEGGRIHGIHPDLILWVLTENDKLITYEKFLRENPLRQECFVDIAAGTTIQLTVNSTQPRWYSREPGSKLGRLSVVEVYRVTHQYFMHNGQQWEAMGIPTEDD